MRVSSGMLQDIAVTKLQSVWGRIQKLQTNISTGRRIQRVSDDPIGADHVMRIRSDLRANEFYSRNLSEARQWIEATEAVGARLVETTETLQLIAVQVADDAYGPEALAGLGAELDGWLEEAIGLANTKYAGMRLFGGQETREEPFQAIYDDEGMIIGVEHDRGVGDLPVRRLVDENLLLTINITGADLFGENLEFFADVIKLRDAAYAGDHEIARDMMEDLDEGVDRVNLAQSLVGGLLNRVEGMESWLEHQNLEMEAARSQHEDLDMAEAAMEYQKEQAILEATLSTVSHLMDLSLVHYM